MKTQLGKEILSFNKLKTHKLLSYGQGFHRHLDTLLYGSLTLSLSMSQTHLGKMVLQQWSIWSLTIFPFALQSESFFFTEDVTCKMFTKTKKEKSEAIYTFSLKNLNPLYKPEKKKKTQTLGIFPLNFQFVGFARKKSKIPR